MQISALIVASLAALLTFSAYAQQSVPDAPHPQKKQAAKPPDPAPPPSPAAVPPPAGDDNAFPEDISKKAAAAATQATQPDSKGADNPFPEEQSKAAAKEAGNESLPKDVAPVHDPVLSQKDAEVGGFYLDKGDYQGALLRFQEAAAADETNVNALFGLAQAQHMLKKNTDAVHNYELYLDIVPNGPKAKQALKALKEIQAGK